MGKNILIAGGSGMIGAALSEFLRNKGYEIAILSRSPEKIKEYKAYDWDTEKERIDPAAVPWADVIINLAGAGIADKRWTDERKKVILKSRTESTDLLVREVLKQKSKKKLKFINASAIGYYPDSGSRAYTEEDSPGEDFLSVVCKQWEASLEPLKNQDHVQWNIGRIGLVLSDKGGALAKLLPLFKMGIAHYFGDGHQIWSWIHIQDIVGGFHHMMDQEKSGVYNLVAPSPAEAKDFSQTLADTMKFTLPNLPVPAFVMKTVLGEMSQILLTGAPVAPSRLQEEGYDFYFPQLKPAFEDLKE